MSAMTQRIVFRLLASCSACLVFQAPTWAEFRSADERFSMALTGDSIITRKLSVYDEPEYLQMIDLIRGADVAFTNLEVLFHDYEPYPMATSGGTWMRAAPELAAELSWAGFDLLARANNHTGDYGVEGMRLTTRHVREAGLLDAGVGESLAEAREAKFLETSKARVALISLSSSFATHMGAGASRDDMPARPGLNPLRYDTTYEVTADEFDRLKALGMSLGQFTDQDGDPRGLDEDKPDEMELFGRDFRLTDNNRVRTTANEKDVEAIAAVVSNAKRLADFVIVTIHAHEGHKRSEPAEFLPVFARAMIDAGADVFVGHGPHALRGIEIYDGKPIMYSLGDFIFQNETLLRLPYDNYARYKLGENAHLADFNDKRYKNDSEGFPANPEIWEAVVAVPVFENRELVELALHPITLGYGLPRQVRGRPMLADAELGAKIINDLRERSTPFGTRIVERRGIGYVDLEGN
ncbi:CapA family protein [Congregibacter sp.]|jgi:poly-gamma-glutamate capsule biosynthesis protein CapA/YwtB (metallophosphatase superfamily)|uniref:CapA family protein n=1 Tax=Congregibacter sp. TaxID=2744308 RepID=UPI0039E5B95F